MAFYERALPVPAATSSACSCTRRGGLWAPSPSFFRRPRPVARPCCSAAAAAPTAAPATPATTSTAVPASSTEVLVGDSSAVAVDLLALNQGAGAAAGVAACPLHACLQRYGIDDMSCFNSRRHRALSEHNVQREVEPKLAALSSEGLTPGQMKALLGLKCGSPLWCSTRSTFLPNLIILSDIVARRTAPPAPAHPKQPQLSALGAVLASAPAPAGTLLSRAPEKVRALLYWARSKLGVTRADLADSPQLLVALAANPRTAEGVRTLLLSPPLGLSLEQAAAVFVRSPTIFRCNPATLEAKLAVLEGALGIKPAVAVDLLQRLPRLFTSNIAVQLPPLLEYVDELFGDVGVGRNLMLINPLLGTSTRARAEREVEGMLQQGYTLHEVRAAVATMPSLLMANQASGAQQQKRAWFASDNSPWPPEALEISPRLRTTSLRRLAGRVEFLAQHGLPRGLWSAETVARVSDEMFMARVSKKLGRVLSLQYWEAWLAVWLTSESGRQWGFPPLAEDGGNWSWEEELT